MTFVVEGTAWVHDTLLRLFAEPFFLGLANKVHGFPAGSIGIDKGSKYD